MAQPKIVNIYSIVPICFAHLHQTFPVFYLKKTMLRSFLLSMMDLVCLQYSIRSKKNSNSYSTICKCIDNFEPSISFNMGQRQADECLVKYTSMSGGGGGGHLFTPLYLAISINFILLKIMIDCARKLRLREKNRVKDERG